MLDAGRGPRDEAGTRPGVVRTSAGTPSATLAAAGAPLRACGGVTIGASIFLIAVGAILKFAVTASVAGVDLKVVGVILMVAGALGLVLGFAQQAMRARQPPTG
jgi:hypothetical protein